MDAEVFVPAEQRLMWKLTASMLRRRRAAFLQRSQPPSQRKEDGEVTDATASQVAGMNGGADSDRKHSQKWMPPSLPGSKPGSRAASPSGGRRSGSISASPSEPASPLRGDSSAALQRRLGRAVEGMVNQSLGEEAQRQRVATMRRRQR